MGTQITCRPFVSMKVALTRVVPSVVNATPWYAGPSSSQTLAAQANRWAVHADTTVIIGVLLWSRVGYSLATTSGHVPGIDGVSVQSQSSV